MIEETTIEISQKTKNLLEEEKDHKSDTYDEIIKGLLLKKEQRLKRKIKRAKKQEDSYTLEEIKERHFLTFVFNFLL